MVTPADISPTPDPGVSDSEICEGLVLTDNIVPEADGAESDEGKVETLAEAPALHMAEDHGWEDENDQRPQGQEDSQAQDLQYLERGRESISESTWETPGLYGGRVWGKFGSGTGSQLSPFSALQTFGAGPGSPCQGKSWSEGLHWWLHWKLEVPLG